MNVQRLKAYKTNLIILPLKEKNRPDTTKMKLIQNFEKIKQPDVKLKVQIPTEEEKDFQAFITLRKARADVRFLGKRLKKKNAKSNWEESKKSKKKRGEENCVNE